MRTGKVSENVLKRSVLRQLKKKRQEMIHGAGIGEDCAIFAFSDTESVVTCMQEGTPGPGEESGTRWLSQKIIKCMNNLAAAGGEPVAIELTLLLPENFEEAQLKELMKTAEETCESFDVSIAGGQTRVTPAVAVPVCVIQGIGKRQKDKKLGLQEVRAGQDIVISKWIGLEGTAVLAKRHREELLKRYPVYFIEEAAGFDRYLSIIPEAATAVKSGVCAMHDASEGGIFGTLWELAQGAGVGLTIDLKKLPIRQETVEVCELCNVNPYELLSGGCLVMTTQDGVGLVETLEQQGIPAVIVGKITSGKERVLLNEDEIRYMDKPKQDQIELFQTGDFVATK